MAEEISNTVNLDLNLSPDTELGLWPTTNDATVVFAHWANGRSGGESESLRRVRSWRPSRFRRINTLPVLAETHSSATELSPFMISSSNGSALPVGERSIAVGERVSEDSKKCENGNGLLKEESVTEEKKVTEKSNRNDGSFFDCCICLDLSKDPVVTNCGHLYCWSCLYQWLQVSEAKECPVCKGEVSVKTLTPIYGQGKNKRGFEEVSDTKIPSRPQARRVESLRNSLNRSGDVPTEMMRYLQDSLGRESSTDRDRRVRSLLDWFMTSRGLRAEQNTATAAVVPPLDDMEPISNIVPEHEGENEHLRAFRDLSALREIQAERSLRMLSDAERSMDAYLMFGRNQEQNNNTALGFEDRDSYSSIVGEINSEIDPMVTVSTSSSVRRHENGSRVSDVDSADSRPLWTWRRRRLA